MKPLFIALICCICCNSLSAQTNYSVKGTVVDTASSARLWNSTISVLNAKDSTLLRFTRADETGAFALKNLRKGNFILLITYPGYADYTDRFVLDSAKTTIDFGNVNLILKARLLKEVLVKGTVAAIKIKGDTTEFNAGSFKIQPNASVEDLLKQLPGITIDKDGKITAQGQTVTKVLVDGEEFFGDDPTLVTKNLRGDMVDKVQLYDKKSDQATFTGIDDGEKTKTLNIKLKEDKKNGYFGKVDVGKATADYFQGQGMINMFKAKKKLAAYANSANTGKTGLGWEDNNKYGTSNVQVTDDGGFYFSGGGDDLESYDGRYNGEGTPLANTGGAHYDSKWNKDNESINLNYKVGKLEVDGINNSLYQNTLPAGIIHGGSNQNFNNYLFRQKLDATYQIKIDTTSTIKIMVDGTFKNNNTTKVYFSDSYREDNTRLNNSDRTVTNDGKQQVVNASLLWTKKLQKKGRTLSVLFSEAANHNSTDGYVNSINRFYSAAQALDSTRTVDQYKTTDLQTNVLGTSITYTEPLSKTLSLVLSYGLNINNGSSDRRSFNKSGAGEYDVLDPLYSNNFELNQLSNQGGAIFNYKKGKNVINFGSKITRVNFDQQNLYTNTNYKRNFINWSPQANYRYNFSQQKGLRISYNGNTSQPNIDQIQPVRANTDPLNISVGNPDLKPSFTNRFNVNYNSYKVLSQQSIYIGANYSFTMNQIVSNRIINSAGKSIYQSINLSEKNNFTYSVYGNYYQKIKKLDMNAGLNLNINGNTYYGYINNVLNTQENVNYNFNINLFKSKEKKYDFQLYGGPSYNVGRSSLQPQLNNNSLNWDANGSFSIYLPGKVQIGASANYQFKQKTQAFADNFDRVLMNSSISKKFLKKETLKFSLSGNDLLNQNVGFNRSAFYSNTYTTIKRYYLMSLTWDFNKMGGVKTP